MAILVTNEESAGKKKKKGFKVDRRENYLKSIAKRSTGKDKKNEKAAPAREKKIVFDDKARREYLLTLHKKKNERRVMAFVDTKQKMKKTNLKSRLEQKEQARKAYNKFAKVPILPNYTYQLPKFKEDLGSDEEEEEGSGLSQLRSIRQKKRIVLEKESTHAMPATMVGGAEGPSNRVDDEFVTVEVKPLFGGEGPITNQGSNFSDLPSAVEQELIRLRRETKGPAKTKSKIHMLKELEKIRKIKKYSRKGHGKKTTSGKRKNRKK